MIEGLWVLRSNGQLYWGCRFKGAFYMYIDNSCVLLNASDALKFDFWADAPVIERFVDDN